MNATLTRSRLFGYIMRRNLGNAALGCLVLGWAAFFWALSYLCLVYGLLLLDNPEGVREVWSHFRPDTPDVGEEAVQRAGVPAQWAFGESLFLKPFVLLSPPGKCFLAGSLVALAGLGFACRHVFFFSVREVAPPFFFRSGRFGNGGWDGFGFLAVLLIAPLATYWGLHFFRDMVLPWPGRIGDACKAYRLLRRSGDWEPYPPLYSQRRAVDLLASLDLVRISSRFGKREVKASGRRLAARAMKKPGSERKA